MDLSASVDQNLNLTMNRNIVFGNPQDPNKVTAYHWWQSYYYPQVIKESYPVYIQEKSLDKGAKAYEIVKHLRDKDFIKITTAKQFVDVMDSLIKML